MKIVLLILAGAFVLFVGAPQARADTSFCDGLSGNLVGNCGFEIGDFTAWTLTGNDVPLSEGTLYGVEGTDPFPTPDGTDPNSGSWQAFFADQAADPTTLSQDLSTVASASYTISWFLAEATVGAGTNNSFAVTFGGAPVTTITNLTDQGYTQYSFMATATSATSTLSFVMGNDPGEFLLDDISVIGPPTPEPGSIALTLLGGAAMAWRMRRRRSS